MWEVITRFCSAEKLSHRNHENFPRMFVGDFEDIGDLFRYLERTVREILIAKIN